MSTRLEEAKQRNAERMSYIRKNLKMLQLLQYERIEVVKQGSKLFTKCLFHNDAHPSAQVGEYVITCYSGCNKKSYGTESVYDILHPNKPFNDKLAELESILGVEVKEDFKKATTPTTQGANIEKVKYIISQCKPIKKNDTIYNYLKDRNILEEAKKVIANKNIDIRIGKNCFNNKDWITYVFNSSSSDPNKTFIIQKSRNNDGSTEKRNRGKQDFFILNNDKNISKFAICEGIEDSLSAIKLGYNAISLNSVNNTSKFLEYLKNNVQAFKGITFYLFLDTDKAGIEAENSIIDFFDINNLIQYNIGLTKNVDILEFMQECNINDLNQYIGIMELIKEQEQEEHKKEINLILYEINNYMKNNNSSWINATQEYLKAIQEHYKNIYHKRHINHF